MVMDHPYLDAGPEDRSLAARARHDAGPICTGLDWLAIRGRSRSGRVAALRAEVCRVLYEQGWSSVELGELLGRHYSTVLEIMGRRRRT